MSDHGTGSRAFPAQEDRDGLVGRDNRETARGPFSHSALCLPQFSLLASSFQPRLRYEIVEFVLNAGKN